ncbi:MAG: hypothetical protein R3F13_11890 [Prosthecobacter sp.]
MTASPPPNPKISLGNHQVVIDGGIYSDPIPISELRRHFGNETEILVSDFQHDNGHVLCAFWRELGIECTLEWTSVENHGEWRAIALSVWFSHYPAKLFQEPFRRCHVKLGRIELTSSTDDTEIRRVLAQYDFTSTDSTGLTYQGPNDQNVTHSAAHTAKLSYSVEVDRENGKLIEIRVRLKSSPHSGETHQSPSHYNVRLVEAISYFGRGFREELGRQAARLLSIILIVCLGTLTALFTAWISWQWFFKAALGVK